MTARATADDGGVINACCRIPYHRIVAKLAASRCVDMCWRFASSGSAIVATHTSARNVVVIEVGRRPSGRRMAGIALRIRY